jgi:hypothetical protein
MSRAEACPAEALENGSAPDVVTGIVCRDLDDEIFFHFS